VALSAGSAAPDDRPPRRVSVYRRQIEGSQIPLLAACCSSTYEFAKDKHWVMVVMDVFTRRIVGFGVESGSVDGLSACRMFQNATTRQPLPKHVSTDHDPLFRFHRWLANLRVLEIDEIKSIPYTPVSHPFVERLIGTIRREHLDQTLFWNSFDLARKLEEFKIYYNNSRVHQSLGGVTPAERTGKLRPFRAALDSFGWKTHCRGLFQTPVAG
jgi:putative transposase